MPLSSPLLLDLAKKLTQAAPETAQTDDDGVTYVGFRDIQALFEDTPKTKGVFVGLRFNFIGEDFLAFKTGEIAVTTDEDDIMEVDEGRLMVLIEEYLTIRKEVVTMLLEENAKERES